MKVMVTFRFPVDTGNDIVRSGKIGRVFEQLLADIKPEAAYFHPVRGDRGGHFIVEMANSSRVAEVAERIFFGLGAKVEMTPVMDGEDLKQGLANVDDVLKTYEWRKQRQGRAGLTLSRPAFIVIVPPDLACPTRGYLSWRSREPLPRGMMNVPTRTMKTLATGPGVGLRELTAGSAGK